MTLNSSASTSDSNAKASDQAEALLSAEYAAASLLSVAVWDSCLSIRLEYLVFGRGRSTVLKWLYFAGRFLGLATGALLVTSFSSHSVNTSRRCSIHSKVTIGFVAAACIVRLLLRSYRIVALYNFNRKILVVLCSITFVTAVVQCYLISHWVALKTSPGLRGCYPVPDPGLAWVGPLYWSPLVIESAILFGLSVYRSASHSLKGSTDAKSSLSFSTIFWRDGARFQALALVINITALVLFSIKNPLPGLFFLPFASIGNATLTCRLVHNLRPRHADFPTPLARRSEPEVNQGHRSDYVCREFGSVQSEVPAVLPSFSPNEPNLHCDRGERVHPPSPETV